MMGFSCLFTLFKAGALPGGPNPQAVCRKHSFLRLCLSFSHFPVADRIVITYNSKRLTSAAGAMIAVLCRNLMLYQNASITVSLLPLLMF